MFEFFGKTEPEKKGRKPSLLAFTKRREPQVSLSTSTYSGDDYNRYSDDNSYQQSYSDGSDDHYDKEEGKLKMDDSEEINEPGIEKTLSTFEPEAEAITENESAEPFPSYNIRRSIASKVIAKKVSKGYSLLKESCAICEMPLMEIKGKSDCKVCPMIKKWMKKRAIRNKDGENADTESRDDDDCHFTTLDVIRDVESEEAQVTDEVTHEDVPIKPELGHCGFIVDVEDGDLASYLSDENMSPSEKKVIEDRAKEILKEARSVGGRNVDSVSHLNAVKYDVSQILKESSQAGVNAKKESLSLRKARENIKREKELAALGLGFLSPRSEVRQKQRDWLSYTSNKMSSWDAAIVIQSFARMIRVRLAFVEHRMEERTRLYRELLRGRDSCGISKLDTHHSEAYSAFRHHESNEVNRISDKISMVESEKVSYGLNQQGCNFGVLSGIIPLVDPAPLEGQDANEMMYKPDPPVPTPRGVLSFAASKFDDTVTTTEGKIIDVAHATERMTNHRGSESHTLRSVTHNVDESAMEEIKNSRGGDSDTFQALLKSSPQVSDASKVYFEHQLTSSIKEIMNLTKSGWKIANKSCNQCQMPLMVEPHDGNQSCVLCAKIVSSAALKTSATFGVETTSKDLNSDVVTQPAMNPNGIKPGYFVLNKACPYCKMLLFLNPIGNTTHCQSCGLVNLHPIPNHEANSTNYFQAGHTTKDFSKSISLVDSENSFTDGLSGFSIAHQRMISNTYPRAPQKLSNTKPINHGLPISTNTTYRGHGSEPLSEFKALTYKGSASSKPSYRVPPNINRPYHERFDDVFNAPTPNYNRVKQSEIQDVVEVKENSFQESNMKQPKKVITAVDGEKCNEKKSPRISVYRCF